MRPRTAAYLLAIVLAAGLSYDLLRMPVQVTDSLEEILAARAVPSAWRAFVGSASNRAYFRPLRIAQIKLLFDAAQGRYRLAYRGFHAALLVVAVWLFTRALRVRTPADFAAASFALLVLTGLHTFRGTVQEAFPINHFLEIVVCSLAALNLAQARGGWLVDVAAAALFAVAALTLESGLLVWVVVVSAWMAGLRGISGRGVLLVSALLAAYLFVRFLYFDVGAPTLSERSSGYGLAVLDPPELERRFGAHPLQFHLYNVVASVLSVVASEPQSGVFLAARAYLRGEVPPHVYIPVAVSLATTALILWSAAGWLRRLRFRSVPEAGQLPLIAAAVIVANAVLSYAYTKDEIVSVAGVFYALAAFAAIRELLAWTLPRSRAAGVALAAVLLVVGSGWAVRSAGLHHVLRSQAFKQRNDWANLPWAWKRNGRWPADPGAQALVLKLYHEAKETPTVNPRFVPRWAERLWRD